MTRGSQRSRQQRRFFKPQLDLLEQRTLLSTLTGFTPHLLSDPSAGLPAHALFSFSNLADNTATGSVVISKDHLELTPGGASDRYTVVLGSQPTANVTITAHPVVPDFSRGAADVPSNGGALTISPTTLTFTPDNWNVAQTVSVSAAAASAAAPLGRLEWVLNTVASDDPNYQQIFIPPVTVLLDQPPVSGAGLVISKDHLEVTPGGTGDSYTVALATQPTAPVTVTITQANPLATSLGTTDAAAVPVGVGGGLTISPTTLTFTPDNWNVAQTVTVSEPARSSGLERQFEWLLHNVTSTDANYNGLHAPPVSVVVNNQSPGSSGGVLFSKHHLDVAPGGAGDSYTVVLTTQPTAEVTITIAQVSPLADVPSVPGAPPVSLTITPTTLTFTHDNWDVAQTVSVSLPGVTTTPEDRFYALSHQVTSADPHYNNLHTPTIPVEVTRPVTDNPDKGVLLSTAHLQLAPGGQGTYTIVLGSQPTADVTITISQASTEAIGFRIPGDPMGVLTITPTTLTFTADNWNVPQTVTVTAPSTLVPGTPSVEGLITTVTSADPNFNGLRVHPVIVVLSSEEGLPTGPPIVLVPPPPGSAHHHTSVADRHGKGHKGHHARAHHPSASVRKAHGQG